MVHMEVEAVPRAPFDQDDVSTREASEEEVETQEEQQTLDRSQSQIIKTSKIQGVLERLENSKAPMEDLNRSISELSVILGKDTEIDRSLSQQYQAVSERSSEVDDLSKRARNLGEDLLEDMLMLDKLSNLEPESRQKRKKAIGSIETLLDTVDGAKSRLSRQQKDVRSHLESTSKQLEEREQKLQKLKEERSRLQVQEQKARQEMEQLPRTKAAGGTRRSTRQEHEAARMQPQQSAAPRGAAPRLEVFQDEQPVAAAAAAAEAQEEMMMKELPLPDEAMWHHVELPVHFESREGRRSYEVAARISSLQTENVGLKLSDDQTTCTIRGIRVPNVMQAKRLQHELLRELHRLGAPPSALATRQQLLHAYATLAKGKFGYFEETFRLPRDVDPSAVQAEYVDDILRVTLPKTVTRKAAAPSLYSGARRQPDMFSGFGVNDFGYF